MNSQQTSSFGDLLRLFRQRKKLSQQLLARKIEVHRNSISLWERDMERPETFSTLLHLATVLALDEEEKRALIEARFGTVSFLSFSNIPFNRNPYFTGREHFLEELHQQLISGGSVAITQAIVGLGGIGKTQLAVEYVYRYQDSYHTIFWISADTAETIIHAFVEAARHLWLPERNDNDEQRILVAVKRWLSSHTRWLLIFDNLEDLGLVKQFVSPAAQGAMLITTRRHVTEPMAQALPLTPLSEEEGAFFLLKRCKKNSVQGDPVFSAAYHQAITIAHMLGGLPLALDQAGAYILETGSSLTDYLSLYEYEQAFLLTQRGSVPTEHPESVTTTFALAFARIRLLNPMALEVLTVCAFLAADDIPEELFMLGAAQLGPTFERMAVNPYLFHAALKDLLAYSLIQRNTVKKTLSMHRLVQVVLRETLSEDEQKVSIEKIALALYEIYPTMHQDKLDIIMWQQCERYLSHLVACLPFYKKLHYRSYKLATLLTKAANYLYQRSRYSEAVLFYQNALQMQEHLCGSEHPTIATTLNNLANVYRILGKFEEASNLLQRALQMQERLLGPEHLDIAITLNNMANLYNTQGKHGGTEGLYTRALHIREKALGTDHSAIAITLNSLATLYKVLGRLEEAEPLFQRALRIGETALGAEHPSLAKIMSNLANVYMEQGRYQDAEILNRRALSIRETALDPEHFDLAPSWYNLAEACFFQERYEESEQYYRRALQIWEGALGSEHPDTAYPLYGLARIYLRQQHYEEAEHLLQKALQIRRIALGTEHPDVAFTLQSLAELYREQAKLEQAEALYIQALHTLEAALGFEHPSVVAILGALGSVYLAQQKPSEAEACYQRALACITNQSKNNRYSSYAEIIQTYISFLKKTNRLEEVEQILFNFPGE